MFHNIVFSFEFLHQLLKQQLLLLMEVKYVLPMGQLLSLMNMLTYLIMNLKILLTELFKIFEFYTTFSWHIVFITFLNLVVCLVAKNNSWDKLFPLKALMFILKVTPVLFPTSDFNLFSCESDYLAFTLSYSTIYIFSQNFYFFCAKF